MKVRLTKLPSVVRRLNLPYEVEITENISSEEGAVIAVEALDEQGANNLLEFENGKMGLWNGYISFIQAGFRGLDSGLLLSG